MATQLNITGLDKPQDKEFSLGDNKMTNSGTWSKSQGGTERMFERLKKELDPKLLDKFQIICSRVRDLEDKKRRTSSNSEDFQELFVDATRNVGVGFGAKDLKQDVKSTRKKEKASSLTDIANDYEALCQRGVQLMRKGELKTSLSLLNKSVEVFYKASEQQSSQLHFLTISIFLDVAEAEDKSSLGAMSPDCYVARCRCYLRQLFVNILFIFFNAFNCLDWVL